MDAHVTWTSDLVASRNIGSHDATLAGHALGSMSWYHYSNSIGFVWYRVKLKAFCTPPLDAGAGVSLAVGTWIKSKGKYSADENGEPVFFVDFFVPVIFLNSLRPKCCKRFFGTVQTLDIHNKSQQILLRNNKMSPLSLFIGKLGHRLARLINHLGHNCQMGRSVSEKLQLRQIIIMKYFEKMFRGE